MTAPQYFRRFSYACLGNNSVVKKDPNGAKDVYYDNTGNHEKTKNNNWFHNLLFGTQRHWGGQKVSKERFWDLSEQMAGRKSVNANEPTIRPYEKNWNDHLESYIAFQKKINPIGGMASDMIKDVMNDASIVAQDFNPLPHNTTNFGGVPATSEQRQLAFINISSFALAGMENYAMKMANSKTFYSVQSIDDALRLKSGGTPWPTSTNKAHFGEGIYTWGEFQHALNYKELLTKQGATNLQIMSFEINKNTLNSLKSINVNALNDASAELFMKKSSLMWGESTNHGFEYITRGTGMGASEHYFHFSTYNKFTIR